MEDDQTIEDDLKTLKVEYLSNNLLDHTQICNLSLDEQTTFYKYFKLTQPHMDDDLKILSAALLSPACFLFFKDGQKNTYFIVFCA
jgi:hypothetical protein